MRRRKRSRNKKIILGIFISLICLLSVGYAAFQTNLNITVKGNLKQGPITIEELKNKYCNITSGDGLYEDPVEEGRCVYKGAEPDNYIKFNNEDWRIISIETDGTIKIMKNPTNTTLFIQKSFDSIGARTTGYCSQGLASQYGCNVWARTDNYVNAHGNFTGVVSEDSEIKTYLNGEYYNSITTNKEKIQMHDFYYGSPTWESADLAGQVIEEKKNSAESNVGLIQASDYIKSNTNVEECGTFGLIRTNGSKCKSTSWMVKDYNEKDKGYWTLSAFSTLTHGVVVVWYYGALEGVRAGLTYDIVPVLYLKSDTTLSGSGTVENPYTITN